MGGGHSDPSSAARSLDMTPPTAIRHAGIGLQSARTDLTACGRPTMMTVKSNPAKESAAGRILLR